ncbi:Histidinol-phosphate aminotransferase 2 [Gimesia panareensis]|uniref:histidinol-phosphate transaminase n=1 Tax=Gimesia panareensis TaxID=2527978 RepID=A0A518FW18_9PLAN|nr:histidinol-phosphate transaminase [Gimesia panareensis]QDV20547.1 Histidinol-phosphate aminotransferase 2 [Gimesia panareensis]
MTAILEKGGGSFEGIKLLLCENPLPPLEEAILAARAELCRSNYYTEPYSAPLRRFLSEQIGVPEQLIHINAGSELILRQIFDRLGQHVHLLTPTYALFPEIAAQFTETQLLPEQNFAFDLSRLDIPPQTTLVVIVNPNNPNGGIFDMDPLPDLLRQHPETYFLIDEAFIGMSGQSVADQVPHYPNLIVTRTLSKAHSLAGFRVGYAILPEPLADDLNRHNDAYPLARPSQAAALATLQHEDQIIERVHQLREWTEQLAAGLRQLNVQTFPTETYFFLADFAPHDTTVLARQLKEHQILIKPLNDARLGSGFMRVTTSLPEENQRFLNVLAGLLK